MKKLNLKKLKPNYSAKDVVLSFQHMFAMLGSTILVPMLCGLSVPLALICAGIGTLIFYFVTKRKVPVFLGSSFALLPCLIAIMSWPLADGLDVVKEERQKSLKEVNTDKKKKRFYWFSFGKKENKEQE